MTERNQRRSGVVLGYANIVVKNAVSLLYTPMLLAYVGQGDYGVFQSANSLVVSLSLLSFGFSGAYVRFYTQRSVEGDEEGIRGLNGTYLLLYLVICMAVIAVGFTIAANAGSFFSGSFTLGEVWLVGRLMRIMSLNVAVTMLSTVFDAYVIAHEEFTFQQSRQMLTTIATPLFAYILLTLGFGTVGVACAQLVISVLLLALNAHFAIGRLRMCFGFTNSGLSLIKEITVFSAWIFLNQICDLVNQNVPNIVLGAFAGANDVAVFAIAVQIRLVFVSLSLVLANVFVPQVNRVVADSGDNDRLTGILVRVGRYQMALLSWVFGGFVLLGRFFIAKWAGEGFSDAYWMLLMMVPPLIVPLSQNVGIEIQKAKNMHRARSLVYVAIACVNVVFTILIAPSLGYWAPTIAYVVSIIVGNCLFMNWYYQKRVRLDMWRYWKSVAPIMLCSAGSTGACVLCAYWLPVNSWVSFFAWSAVFTITYCLLMLSVVLDQGEREALRGVVSAHVWTRGER